MLRANHPDVIYARRQVRIRWLIRIVVVLALLSIISFLGHRSQNSQFLPIKQIKLNATYQHVDPKTLSEIIMPFVNEKNLFTLKMAGLKQALLQQPWIASVVIKRVWPDQITIDIVEQQPLAIWNDQALLAENATVFAAAKNTFPANLPQLYGPEGQQGNVWQQYQQFNQALQPLQLTVSRLVFNSRGSWQIVLNNGIALNLGRTELMPRLQRFIQVYPKLFANRVNQVVLIDLRYPAGLAVQWKTQLSSKE